MQKRKKEFEYRVKQIDEDYKGSLSRFPNFSKTGNSTGMRRLYYGRDAMLVRDGGFIYNVTSEPDIYLKHSH